MDMTEVAKFDQQVGTLKLSDAIRKGCQMKPLQCHGMLFDARSSCAIGAALDGLGISSMTRSDELVKLVGITLAELDEIIFRNDNQRQTREHIADWLQAQGY